MASSAQGQADSIPLLSRSSPAQGLLNTKGPNLVTGVLGPLVKRDGVQVTVPQAWYIGTGNASELYTNLLGLYILCINVTVGVVSSMEGSTGSLAFLTEERGRGHVSRVSGKSLRVIWSGSKAECFLFSLWPAWERLSFPSASVQLFKQPFSEQPLLPLQAWPLSSLLGEGHVAPSPGSMPGCSLTPGSSTVNTSTLAVRSLRETWHPSRL